MTSLCIVLGQNSGKVAMVTIRCNGGWEMAYRQSVIKQTSEKSVSLWPVFGLLRRGDLRVLEWEDIYYKGREESCRNSEGVSSNRLRLGVYLLVHTNIRFNGIFHPRLSRL